MELSQRKQKILAAIVEQYIKTGEPVGSKALLNSLDFSVSSATIRNEMADLASMGYLDQPHTSAGRVPTNLGYRYYVDHLMDVRGLDEALKRRIVAGVSIRNASPEAILERASDFLADMTDCAAVSTTPSDENAVIKRVEFVPVGTRTGMIAMLTSTGIIKSKVCRSDCDLNASLIEKFYKVSEASFIGMPLDDIDPATVQTLAASMGADMLTMIPFISAIMDLAHEAAHTEVMLGGQSNLLHYGGDYANTAYELMEFLRRREPLSRLLSSDKDGVQVRIGNENQYKQLKNSSVIMANYTIDGNKKGSIGIIGPTRMDYAGLIPSVKYLTDIVGKMIEQTLNED